MLFESHSKQPSLPTLCPIEAAVATMANAGVEERGAVFTRREVVDFILDLVGYTVDVPLHRARILEPAAGAGDFLLPTIERLLTHYRLLPKQDRQDIAADLADCLCAVELHHLSFEQTRSAVIEALRGEDCSAATAGSLADHWMHHGDFLLMPIKGLFSHVVENPPYVRQERVPPALMEEYRRRYSTIFDRADLYVPFIERSLSLLAPGGHLGFICADRWMKNRYGAPLRQKVAKDFHIRAFIDMVDTPAFQSDVIAYPAIVVVSRNTPAPTRVAIRPKIDRPTLSRIAKAVWAPKLSTDCDVTEVAAVTAGPDPWLFEAPDQLRLVRRLESEFPTLEQAGCSVKIGVATGSDKVFIAPYHTLDVERDRKLPLVMTSDIKGGEVDWKGFGVINPFRDDGKLVALNDYPKLASYLRRFEPDIKARNIAKRNPKSWYRTIDRIYPELAFRQKLLIPDIKGAAHVVFEDGKLYPHHNLYFIVSDSWNLRALQAVLLSDITRLMISIYSTKMRGGFLRFQAQYLRRIRLPPWRQVHVALRAKLMEAAEARDHAACNALAAEVFNLTTVERNALIAFAEASHGA